jgi:glutamyl-Q tRNA(Asp) synthetase
VTFRTRFAPSPTGPLHLGHAYSALLGFDMATRRGGEWLLRIEDIDRQRSKPEWERQIYEDLDWLGLWWPEPVMRQSERTDAYREALVVLWRNQAVYACDCSRADIAAAVSAPQEGASPVVGPDGIVYPGTCRPGVVDIADGREPMPGGALRLNMSEAAWGPWRPGEKHLLSFQEAGEGPRDERGRVEFTRDEMIRDVGDVVLARRDMGTSYHLSVVLDDAAQGVTHVVRGQDLFEATRIHVVLQRLLGLPTPTYHHHRLVRDETGRRLAKREDAKAIRRFRDEGATPADLRRMVGLDPSLAP